MCHCVQVEAILDRRADKTSVHTPRSQLNSLESSSHVWVVFFGWVQLDMLSRVLADIFMDSSKILNDL